MLNYVTKANVNKIEAIKSLRNSTHLGLKEAKDAVEQMEQGLPWQSFSQLDSAFFVPVSTWDGATDARHVTPPVAPATDGAAALATAIQTILANAVSKDTVREIVREAMNGVVLPTRVEIVNTTREVIFEGTTHKTFPLLCQMAQKRTHDGHRVNVWLVGPAGTGKTTAANQLAQALYGENATIIGISDNKFEVTGYRDGHGIFQSTDFIAAYQRPGVICIDEVDGWFANALLALQTATANGRMSTPDGVVTRHPDCIIICCANTFGYGATVEYCGRMKQDAAFLDRFAFLKWDIDEALEMAFCVNKAWCRRVQGVRARVAEKGIKGVLVTPRATFIGDALLDGNDIPWETVEEVTLRKGMTEEQWTSVK